MNREGHVGNTKWFFDWNTGWGWGGKNEKGQIIRDHITKGLVRVWSVPSQ